MTVALFAWPKTLKSVDSSDYTHVLLVRVFLYVYYMIVSLCVCVCAFVHLCFFV